MTCQRLRSTCSCWYNNMLEQTVAKNNLLSKSLLRFSLKHRNQAYIIAGNTADTWRKQSLKNEKQTNKKII